MSSRLIEYLEDYYLRSQVLSKNLKSVLAYPPFRRENEMKETKRPKKPGDGYLIMRGSCIIGTRQRSLI